MFTLTFSDGGTPRAHRLRDGDTTIGRAPTCDLVITAPLMSRQHARVRVKGGRVLIKDLGSTYGTLLNGLPLTTEQDMAPGSILMVAQVAITLERDVGEDEVLSEHHQLIDDTHTVIRRIDDPTRPVARTPIVATPLAGLAAAAAAGSAPHPPLDRPVDDARSPLGERRHQPDRRQHDLGRAAGDRRSRADRRRARALQLLSAIARTLVAPQPLEPLLTRVVDLLFETVPAERAILLLRDGTDQPLGVRVMRNRDGSIPAKPTISRTIVHRVLREGIAMLAKDARADTRLDASASIQALNIRSVLCAPLWNGRESIGVLYCDNPRARTFTVQDLELFTALCNYAAVAIEQARASVHPPEDTRQHDLLHRQMSAAARARIREQGASSLLVPQVRDVTFMVCELADNDTLNASVDAASMAEALNTFIGRLVSIVFEHEGTLVTVAGNAVAAVFNAPLDQPDHAMRAVDTAIAVRRELAMLNTQRGNRGLQTRTGIDSGRAFTAAIGPPERCEFTVIGDVVRTAAAMAASIAGAGHIVISEHTREAVGGACPVHSLGPKTADDHPLLMFEVAE